MRPTSSRSANSSTAARLEPAGGEPAEGELAGGRPAPGELAEGGPGTAEQLPATGPPGPDVHGPGTPGPANSPGGPPDRRGPAGPPGAVAWRRARGGANRTEASVFAKRWAVLVGIVLVVVIILAIALRSHPPTLYWQGEPIEDASHVLVQAQAAMQSVAAADEGALSSASRCYFSLPNSSGHDVAPYLRCGPVLFPWSSVSAPWLTYEFRGTSTTSGVKVLLASSAPSAATSGLHPAEVLRRPDGAGAPKGSGRLGAARGSSPARRMGRRALRSTPGPAPGPRRRPDRRLGPDIPLGRVRRGEPLELAARPSGAARRRQPVRECLRHSAQLRGGRPLASPAVANKGPSPLSSPSWRSAQARRRGPCRPRLPPMEQSHPAPTSQPLRFLRAVRLRPSNCLRPRRRAQGGTLSRPDPCGLRARREPPAPRNLRQGPLPAGLPGGWPTHPGAEVLSRAGTNEPLDATGDLPGTEVHISDAALVWFAGSDGGTVPPAPDEAYLEVLASASPAGLPSYQPQTSAFHHRAARPKVGEPLPDADRVVIVVGFLVPASFSNGTMNPCRREVAL